MIGKSDPTLADLSPRVQEVLGDFVEAARSFEQKRADQARRAPRPPWWRIWWTWDSGIRSS